MSALITTYDRETAFNITLIGWIIGGLLSLAIMLVSSYVRVGPSFIINLFALFLHIIYHSCIYSRFQFVAKDEDSLQQQLREMLAHAETECHDGIDNISL